MVIINGTSPPTGPQVQSHHCQGMTIFVYSMPYFLIKACCLLPSLCFSHHLKRERTPKGPRWSLDASWRAGH